MGLLGAIQGKQRVQFIQNNNTVIQLDASVKEMHKRASPATKFPVENGSNISDNVSVKPFTLEITGIISDTPIGGIGGLLTETATTLAASLIPPAGLVAAASGAALFSALSGSKSPSIAAYNQLLDLQDKSQPFDVLTSLKRYASMWITDLGAPRESDTGQVLVFTVTLEQLIIVTPQSVNVQIFANPGLSANLADIGQQESSVSGFQQGVNAATAQAQSAQKAFNSLSGG